MNQQTPLEITALNSHLNASHKINASVIWLHGLGADGYDFEPVVNQLQKQFNLPYIRFILPHAPAMAVTRNNGYVMPAWYDLFGVESGKEDDAGITKTQHYINYLIQQEVDKGISATRIAIAGFSQGGAMALHTALRYPEPLAGVLALSTYLPLKAKLASELNTANAHTPIFMAHGTDDEVISITRNQDSRAALRNSQIVVDYHEYKMAHSVCAAEISDIGRFLQKILPADL